MYGYNMLQYHILRSIHMHITRKLVYPFRIG